MSLSINQKNTLREIEYEPIRYHHPKIIRDKPRMTTATGKKFRIKSSDAQVYREMDAYIKALSTILYDTGANITAIDMKIFKMMKTQQLIKSINRLSQVEVSDNNNTTSPTINIINEYKDDNKKSIYHLDLYRLKSINDLVEIGFEEYINSGNYCFIEWPEIADSFFVDKYITINISINSKNSRDIYITFH